MKTKFMIIAFALLGLLGLTSCDMNFGNVPEDGLVITWQNADGTILEVDYNVLTGSVPTYNAANPTKETNGSVSYEFIGWSPTISNVYNDITYIAVYKEIYTGVIVQGMEPIISSDKKTVLYGLYPQTYINDASLITTLSTLTPTTNGWCLYNEEYYVKHQAKVYNNENYTFSDGTKIVEGETYWFKCEPIEWKVILNQGDNYQLLAASLLDAKGYYANYTNRVIDNQTILPNNYQYSDIRSWLNKEFYNMAFAFNSSSIIDSTIEEVVNKVTLLSYQDYLNPLYGFDATPSDKSITRVCQVTDYAKANGAWYNQDTNNGSYWTRSGSSEFDYCAWNVNSGGYLSNYVIDGDNHSIRPSITIKITE